MVSVSDYLIVDFDVDYHVGHIDFVGDVEIHGDVLDDLHIKSGKSIVVTGHVGDCCLEALTDITLGGMSGHQHGTIRCGGIFRARYINGVSLDALDNIFIANEIIDSQVQTAKALSCPAARVIGGCCTALKGIDVGEVGSESNIPTKLVVGHSFIALKLIKVLHQKILRSMDRLKKIIPQTKAYLKNPEKIEKLTETRKKEILSLIDEERKLVSLKLKSEELLKQETLNVTAGANPIISASQGIWQGVKISFGITTEVIKDDLYYPLSIIEDMDTGHFKLIKHTSISKSVDAIRNKKKKRIRSGRSRR